MTATADRRGKRAPEVGVRSPHFVAAGASEPQGLRDLGDLLQALPADLPAVVMVVLLRPIEGLSYLRKVLATRSALPVVAPREADLLRPGVCYVEEPAAHLSLGPGRRVHLSDGAHNRYLNRTVNLLFASVAAQAGPRAIGLVLRGALSDASRGLRAIHGAGGVTMVPGGAGAAAAGMPRNAMAYDGPIDFIGTAAEIAGEIVRRASAAHVGGIAEDPPCGQPGLASGCGSGWSGRGHRLARRRSRAAPSPRSPRAWRVRPPPAGERP